MVTLDHVRRISSNRNALDHIGIKRALREKTITAVFIAILGEQFFGRVLKDRDELVADDFAFCFRIGHAFECIEKTIGSIDVFEFDLKIFAENALHHFFFTRAQQTVVNKNAGKLVADGLVQKRRDNRRIDSTAQTQHHFFFADLLPDARARFFNERPHRPIHGAVADMKDEVLQDLFASRRVRDFRMKLQPVKFSRGIFDRGKLRIFRARDGAKARRKRRQFVAVTAPDIDLRPDAVEQLRIVRQLQIAGAVLASRTEFDLPTEVVRHQLHTVANAQNGNA